MAINESYYVYTAQASNFNYSLPSGGKDEFWVFSADHRLEVAALSNAKPCV